MHEDLSARRCTTIKNRDCKYTQDASSPDLLLRYNSVRLAKTMFLLRTGRCGLRSPGLSLTHTTADSMVDTLYSDSKMVLMIPE